MLRAVDQGLVEAVAAGEGVSEGLQQSPLGHVLAEVFTVRLTLPSTRLKFYDPDETVTMLCG